MSEPKDGGMKPPESVILSRPIVCFDLVSSAAKTTIHYQPN